MLCTLIESVSLLKFALNLLEIGTWAVVPSQCSYLYFVINLQLIATLGLLLGVFSSSAESLWPNTAEKCNGNGSKLKYLTGDALKDSQGCIGPNNIPYPHSTINRAFNNGGSSRKGRQSHLPTTVDPMVMQSTLLAAYREVNDESPSTRHGKFCFHQNCRLIHHRNLVHPVRIRAQKNHFLPSNARKICFFLFKMWKSHHPAKNSYRSFRYVLLVFLSHDKTTFSKLFSPTEISISLGASAHKSHKSVSKIICRK